MLVIDDEPQLTQAMAQFLAEWGLRAYQDKPDSFSWSGQNVYDVYTKATGAGLDGTKYRDW